MTNGHTIEQAYTVHDQLLCALADALGEATTPAEENAIFHKFFCDEVLAALVAMSTSGSGSYSPEDSIDDCTTRL